MGRRGRRASPARRRAGRAGPAAARRGGGEPSGPGSGGPGPEPRGAAACYRGAARRRFRLGPGAASALHALIKHAGLIGGGGCGGGGSELGRRGGPAVQKLRGPGVGGGRRARRGARSARPRAWRSPGRARGRDGRCTAQALRRQENKFCPKSVQSKQLLG